MDVTRSSDGRVFCHECERFVSDMRGHIDEVHGGGLLRAAERIVTEHPRPVEWEDFVRREMPSLPLGFLNSMGSCDSPQWGIDDGDTNDPPSEPQESDQ